jgi:hypothetical protein
LGRIHFMVFARDEMIVLCAISFLSCPNAPDSMSISFKICSDVYLYALHSYKIALISMKRQTYLKNYSWSERFIKVSMIHSPCINRTYIYVYIYIPPHGATAPPPPVDQGLPIIETSRSHLDTSHSVGLLWTSD